MGKPVVRKRPGLDPLDLPDPEDLGTAGDWLGGRVTILVQYDTATDTVSLDRGRFPLTLARSILVKGWQESDDPAIWGEEVEPEPEEED